MKTEYKVWTFDSEGSLAKLVNFRNSIVVPCDQEDTWAHESEPDEWLTREEIIEALKEGLMVYTLEVGGDWWEIDINDIEEDTSAWKEVEKRSRK